MPTARRRFGGRLGRQRKEVVWVERTPRPLYQPRWLQHSTQSVAGARCRTCAGAPESAAPAPAPAPQNSSRREMIFLISLIYHALTGHAQLHLSSAGADGAKHEEDVAEHEEDGAEHGGEEAGSSIA